MVAAVVVASVLVVKLLLADGCFVEVTVVVVGVLESTVGSGFTPLFPFFTLFSGAATPVLGRCVSSSGYSS